MQLRSNETDLEGRWVLAQGRMVKDEVCQRIETLVEKHLTKVKSDKSGWNTLYHDTSDGRYWELTYPHSDMHGGGPPRLSVISSSLAIEKYELER